MTYETFSGSHWQFAADNVGVAAVLAGLILCVHGYLSAEKLAPESKRFGRGLLFLLGFVQSRFAAIILHGGDTADGANTLSAVEGAYLTAATIFFVHRLVRLNLKAAARVR